MEHKDTQEEIAALLDGIREELGCLNRTLLHITKRIDTWYICMSIGGLFFFLVMLVLASMKVIYGVFAW
jgi:hypothetical protein